MKKVVRGRIELSERPRSPVMLDLARLRCTEVVRGRIELPT
jgi:hypothetical protein